MGNGNKIAPEKPRKRFHIVHLLLIVPFVGLLSVGFYNRAEPAIGGVPFFYWYQMLWILIGAALLIPVYLVEDRTRK